MDMNEVENRSIMSPLPEMTGSTFSAISDSNTGNLPFSLFGSNLLKTLGENYAKMLQANASSNEVRIQFSQISF